MSEESAVTEHAVWTTLESASDALSDGIDDADEEFQVQLARISVTLAAIADIRNNVPSDLIPIETLTQMNSAANAANSQLTNFKNQAQHPQKQAHLDGAEAGVDGIRHHAGWLLPYAANVTGDNSSALSAMASAIEAAHERTSIFEARVEELETHLAETAETETSRITDEAISVSAQIKEVAAAVAENRALHQHQFESHAEEFRSAQASRETAFEEVNASNDMQAKASLEKLEAARKQGEEMAGLLAVSALAKGYSEDADAEAIAMRRFRSAAILIALLGIGFAVWAFGSAEVTNEEGNKVFEIDRFAGRSSVFLLLAALSAYLGAQSGAHRRAASIARQLQRQLQSLEPYIESLPVESRAQVRLDMVKHFFPAFSPDAGFGSVDNPSLWVRSWAWLSAPDRKWRR
jgi:hypothetical protein